MGACLAQLTEGEEPRYEDKKRIYQIPPNGILKTKAHFNKGVISPDKRSFFSIEASENLIPLRFGDFNSKDGQNKTKIIGNMGVVGTSERKKNTGGGLYYFVGTKADYIRKKGEFQSFIENATKI